MDAVAPEIRALEIFRAIVAQQLLDVLAYERRLVIAACLEAVDHRRRASEKVLDPIARRRRRFLGPLALGYVAP